MIVYIQFRTSYGCNLNVFTRVGRVTYVWDLNMDCMDDITLHIL